MRIGQRRRPGLLEQARVLIKQEIAEAYSLRDVYKIVGRRNAVGIKLVEYRTSERLVHDERCPLRNRLTSRQVTKRSSCHQVRAVGKGRPKHRTEVAVVNRKGLGKCIVKGDIPLIVEAHRFRRR